MKKIRFLCLPALLCLAWNTRAQTADFSRAKWLSPVSTAQLENKFIILDFFATWCGPCVSALSHLDSVQRRFSDDVKIIVVTRESLSVIRSFVKKRPSLSLSFIVEDTSLNKTFPNVLIPHEVILDRSHRFMTATYAASITHENIARLIRDNSAAFFPVKKDRRDFDPAKPLTANLSDMHIFRSQSVITDYMPGTGSRSGIRKDSVHARWFFINMPLIDLLQIANGRNASAPYRLSLTDTARLIRTAAPGNNEHLICYEITLPADTPRSEMLRLMRADLESRFRLQTTVISPPDSPLSVLMISQNIHQP